MEYATTTKGHDMTGTTRTTSAALLATTPVEMGPSDAAISYIDIRLADGLGGGADVGSDDALEALWIHAAMSCDATATEMVYELEVADRVTAAYAALYAIELS
jgi:hypothetical protein